MSLADGSNGHDGGVISRAHARGFPGGNWGSSRGSFLLRAAPPWYGGTWLGCSFRLRWGTSDQRPRPIAALTPTLETSRFLPSWY